MGAKTGQYSKRLDTRSTTSADLGVTWAVPVDIAGILAAESVDEWKAIATRRLEVLDAEIERLTRARAYLQGALLCRYDHPASDCRIMGAEIDRRLSSHG